MAVRRVVTATGRRRTSPNPSVAPGSAYLRPTTSIAEPPRTAPMAAIAIPPASAAARGPPSVRAAPTRGSLFGDVRDQGDRAEALEGARELALVARAVAGDAARDDLAALRHE